MFNSPTILIYCEDVFTKDFQKYYQLYASITHEAGVQIIACNFGQAFVPTMPEEMEDKHMKWSHQDALSNIQNRESNIENVITHDLLPSVKQH